LTRDGGTRAAGSVARDVIRISTARQQAKRGPAAVGDAAAVLALGGASRRRAPAHVRDAAAAAAVLKFRAQALAQRSPDLLADFPAVDVEGKNARAWRAPAVRIYANWLSLLLKSRFAADERAIE